MLNALDASRGNTPALALAGQLLYAKMDLAVHSEPERFSAGSLDDVDSAVAGDMDYFKDFKRAGKLRTARHLFSSPAGYASFYFSYQWAEVLDKDILKPLNGPEARTGKRQENSGKPFWKRLCCPAHAAVHGFHGKKAAHGRHAPQEAAGILK